MKIDRLYIKIRANVEEPIFYKTKEYFPEDSWSPISNCYADPIDLVQDGIMDKCCIQILDSMNDYEN